MRKTELFYSALVTDFLYFKKKCTIGKERGGIIIYYFLLKCFENS